MGAVTGAPLAPGTFSLAHPLPFPPHSHLSSLPFQVHKERKSPKHFPKCDHLVGDVFTPLTNGGKRLPEARRAEGGNQCQQLQASVLFAAMSERSSQATKGEQVPVHHGITLAARAPWGVPWGVSRGLERKDCSPWTPVARGDI